MHFLNYPTDRARANSHVFVEIAACKNSSPNIIVVHASAQRRDLRSAPIDASRTPRDIVKRYRKVRLEFTFLSRVAFQSAHLGLNAEHMPKIVRTSRFYFPR